MNQFSVSNQRQTEIKQVIIDLFYELKDQEFIKEQFQFVYPDNTIKEDTQLTLQSFINLKYILFDKLIG